MAVTVADTQQTSLVHATAQLLHALTASQTRKNHVSQKLKQCLNLNWNCSANSAQFFILKLLTDIYQDIQDI